MSNDLRDLLDRALGTANGLSLRLETPGKATNFIQKLNTFRRGERQESRLIYPPDHRMFGRSPWDGLKFTKENECVLIERLTADILEIKEL